MVGLYVVLEPVKAPETYLKLNDHGYGDYENKSESKMDES